MQKLPSAFALPKKYVFSHLWMYDPVFNPCTYRVSKATEEEWPRYICLQGAANEEKMTKIHGQYYELFEPWLSKGTAKDGSRVTEFFFKKQDTHTHVNAYLGLRKPQLWHLHLKNFGLCEQDETTC